MGGREAALVCDSFEVSPLKSHSQPPNSFAFGLNSSGKASKAIAFETPPSDCLRTILACESNSQLADVIPLCASACSSRRTSHVTSARFVLHDGVTSSRASHSPFPANAVCARKPPATKVVEGVSKAL
ncbi:hypothetical protein HPB48_009044 [Haemaphysalis longicornis]|uniref:Uncharacterized protein n=1 Tax=Haemaphysalis longicornis TaxID=44386 RepID=A0A9J6H320_HAELO|nr:hypothetical protein HPB48_009044 [Haemaphysalis longicornis]